MESRVLPYLGFTRWSSAFSSAPPLWHVVIAWLLLTFWAGIYRSAYPPDRWSRLVGAAHAAIAVTCAIVIASFLSAEAVRRSRSIVLTITPLSFVLFSLSRLASRSLAHHLLDVSNSRRGVAVLGCSDDAIAILEYLQTSNPDVRGLIVPKGYEMSAAASGAPILGTTTELAEVINREKLDRIVMLNGSLSDHEMERCNQISSRMGVTVSCTVAVAAPAKNLNYSVYNGLPLLEIQPVALTAAERILKRVFDIVGSLVLLIFLAPLMAAIAFLIKATSDGPILFAAARVGKGGRYFTFLKFRTMYANGSRRDVVARNEKDGHIFKIKQDPRITPIGRILRRFSLDELPQLINVLIGDMSLVGPRPLPIEDMEPDGMSRRFAIWSEQRASVPPGLTGLWQIRGRSELPFSDLVRYDLEYVHNWSIRLDLRILLSTPKFVFTGKGAY